MAEANKYENNILGREYVTDIDIDTDYIRTLDENGVSYKDDMGKIAKVFMEDYDDSILGGEQRSVKGAFSDIFTRVEARTCTVEELELIETKLGI